MWGCVIVLYDLFFAGAAPKPCVTSLKQTKDWTQLQCEVRGAFPRPKIEWKDSLGNILPTKEPQVTERGSYNVILQTTVTKTNKYHCVATQKEINHQISTEIDVCVPGKANNTFEISHNST